MNNYLNKLFIVLITFLYSIFCFSQNTQQCDQYIKIGVEAMFNRDFITAIDNLNKAQEIVNQEGGYKQQFLIYNNFGLIHFKMQDYLEAVNYYVKAYELAMSNKEPIDEMTVLNNIAVVYAHNNNRIQAKEYLLKSYEIATKENILSRIAIYATNIAFLSYELKNYEEAQEYINIISNIPEQDIEQRTYVNFLIVKNTLSLEKGYTEKVIQECKDIIKRCEKNNLPEEKTEALILLAKAYKEKSDWVKSLSILNQALEKSNNKEVKIRIYEQKSEAYIKGNLYSNALIAKDSIIKLNQLINSSQNKELLENATLKFELSESKYALEKTKLTTQNQRKVYLLLIITLFLIIMILGVIFYKRNILSKQKKIIIENTLKIKNLELEKEKNKRELLEKELKERELLTDLKIKTQKEKEQKLNREIELKNKQLSDKILFQSTRNELLENIIESISSKSEVKESKTLLKTIKDLKTHLKEDAKWEDFSELFENVNNEFLKKLKQKHTNLNANDIRFLSFIYLNLNTKEIASLLNISPESCRKRKERLRYKLEIDKEIDLFEYLSVFS